MNAATKSVAGRIDRSDEERSRGRAVTRVQLDLPPRSMQRLTAMKDKTEAASYAEVVRRALQVYEDLVNQIDQGNEFMIRKENGDTYPYNVFL